jgi:magnesium-transporting ATPase (P-type)
MSLTAFVTSNARYKVDVNSKNRTNNNFTRDDTYMAERADTAKFIKAKDVIKGGPSVSYHKKGRKGKKSGTNSFAYTMNESFVEKELGATDTSAVNATASDKLATGDNFPVASGESPELSFFRQGLSGGVLCSKCTLGKDGSKEGEIGNPTELSILRACYWAGINVDSMKEDTPVIAEVPFSSEYKFMATVHASRPENDGDGMEAFDIVHAKGAPDRMIPLCKNQAKAGMLSETEEVDRAYWIEQIAILSSHGLRVLALTRGTIPKDSVPQNEQLGAEFVNGKGAWLTIVGLCAIIDPPRPECVDAVAEAKGAGVRVAMITGDHKDTALAIGAMLGLVDAEHNEAITGPELDAMDDPEMMVATKKYNVFARASPQNKIRIVKALQAQKEVCGMTGDGVNDAPALKAADMGVAMGKEGTDVAREASQMILADDNFATIIVAVKEGRVVWDNLRKVLMVNTPINNAQGLSVLFGFVTGMERSPLTAIQVLYCNLICAVTLGFVCAVEPAEDGIMNHPPRRVGKRLIGRFLFLRIALGTIVLVACTVSASWWAVDQYKDLDVEDKWEKVRSQASNTLTFGAAAITLSARFSYNSAFHSRLFTGNKYAWYAVIITAVLQVCITYIPGLNNVIFQMGPMDGAGWGIVVAGMAITFVIMEIEKAVRRNLSQQGSDTDDLEYGVFDAPPGEEEPDMSLPQGLTHLKLTQLRK